MTFRHPLEVAASLAKRDQVPVASSMLLYFTSYLKSEIASRDCPRCFVSYAQALSDWRVVDSKLRSIVGSRLPMLDDKRSSETAEFVAPELRHHSCDRAELARRNEIPGIVADLYDLLIKAEAGGSETSLSYAFDELLRSAGGITALFRDLVRSERAERKALENSTSWRMTAPLRWLKNGLRDQALLTSSIGCRRNSMLSAPNTPSTLPD
jgi:hypothetical protein